MKKPRVTGRDKRGQTWHGRSQRCRGDRRRHACQSVRRLGLHEVGKGFVARCFIPRAETVTAYTLDGKEIGELSRRDDAGFFEGSCRSASASRSATTPAMPAATGG